MIDIEGKISEERMIAILNKHNKRNQTKGIKMTVHRAKKTTNTHKPKKAKATTKKMTKKSKKK